MTKNLQKIGFILLFGAIIILLNSLYLSAEESKINNSAQLLEDEQMASTELEQRTTIEGDFSDLTLQTGTAIELLNGLKATDATGADLTENIILAKGNFKGDGTDLPGEYEIKYSVIDTSGNVTEKVRQITVEAPAELTAVKETTIQYTGEIETTEGTAINLLEDVKATDADGTDLTEKVLIEQGQFKGDGTDKAGEYEIKYTVLDHENQEVAQTRAVKVTQVAAEEPVITLASENEVITVGTKIDLSAGVSASNSEGTDLTSKVTIEQGQFKGDGTDKAGEYKIVYTVTDDNNLATSVEKMITVEEPAIQEKTTENNLTKTPSDTSTPSILSSDNQEVGLTVTIDTPEEGTTKAISTNPAMNVNNKTQTQTKILTTGVSTYLLLIIITVAVIILLITRRKVEKI